MINAVIQYIDGFVYALFLNVLAAVCSVVSLPIMTMVVPPMTKAILKIIRREDALTEITRDEREKNNIIHLYDGQYYFIQMSRSLTTLLDELVPTYVFEVRKLTRRSTKSRKTLATIAALWFVIYHLIVNTLTASVIGDSTLYNIIRCEEGWANGIEINAGDARFSKFLNGSFDTMKMRAWNTREEYGASLPIALTNQGSILSQQFSVTSNDTHYTFTPTRACYGSWYWCYKDTLVIKDIYIYEKSRIHLVTNTTYQKAYESDDYFQFCSPQGDEICDPTIMSYEYLLSNCLVEVHAAWSKYLIFLCSLAFGGVVLTLIRNSPIIPAIPLQGVSTQLRSYYLSDLTALYATIAATLNDNKCGRHWSARFRGFGISVDGDDTKHIGVKLFLHDTTEKERKDELQISELEEKLAYYGNGPGITTKKNS